MTSVRGRQPLRRQIAQTVLRDHPEFVRSAILSGVYPIEDNLIGSTPAAFEQAMLEIFAACEADPGCDELLPDPVATLEAWVDRLDIEPAVVPDVNILHGLLYSADGASLIPDLLIDLEAGDRDRLERLAVAEPLGPSHSAVRKCRSPRRPTGRSLSSRRRCGTASTCLRACSEAT